MHAPKYGYLFICAGKPEYPGNDEKNHFIVLPEGKVFN
jgi:hypothetical protein